MTLPVLQHAVDCSTDQMHVLIRKHQQRCIFYWTRQAINNTCKDVHDDVLMY